MATLEERLNAPSPPRTLDAADVEMYMLAGPVAFIGPRDYQPPLLFTWHGNRNGRLDYYFWVDGDGERYYRWPEFWERSGAP